MGFNDSAHTTDRVSVGLSVDTGGKCKGQHQPCPMHEPHRSQWCSYCKAKAGNTLTMVEP